MHEHLSVVVFVEEDEEKTEGDENSEFVPETASSEEKAEPHSLFAASILGRLYRKRASWKLRPILGGLSIFLSSFAFSLCTASLLGRIYSRGH